MAIKPVLIPERGEDGLSKLAKLSQIGGTIAAMVPGGQAIGAGLAGAGTLLGMASQARQTQTPTAPLVQQQGPDVDSSIALRKQDIDPQLALNEALAQIEVLDIPEEQKNIYRQPLLQAYQKGGFA